MQKVVSRGVRNSELKVTCNVTQLIEGTQAPPSPPPPTEKALLALEYIIHIYKH
jgi:hypothetical protein